MLLKHKEPESVQIKLKQLLYLDYLLMNIHSKQLWIKMNPKQISTELLRKFLLLKRASFFPLRCAKCSKTFVDLLGFYL